MKIRIGIEGNRRAVLERLGEIKAPILVSANSLWRDKKKQFIGWECYKDFDVALDSGGFVAMKRYGGYRWTIDQYVDLAARMVPSFWAQMDFCCEPEIASSHEQVVNRVKDTARYLCACEQAALNTGTALPMPVLQGWQPEDYCNGPIYNRAEWPSLVGIGSVCRRPVNGATGVIAIVEALDKAVPSYVKFHLFGVKSTALKN